MCNKDIKILVVDDEVNFTTFLKKVLLSKGFTVFTETDSIKAKERLESESFDIVISDLQMPDVDGMELLKAKDDDTIFIMVTGYGSVDSAVESMKIGAFDYIGKPFKLDEFLLKVDNAVKNILPGNKMKIINSELEENGSFEKMVGSSKKMKKVFEMIDNVADSDTNVFIEGQSGTGKELVARAIHERSSRKKGPFVAINCSAIPDALLESELFGHIKGAYTGAMETQKGVFELANGGTLLLDEIAEMPFNLQSKLLRVIETWEIKPLGSDRVKKVNVRLISATNQNITEIIKDKKFREDLYYRISTFTISLPSLNERSSDIPLLVDHFLKLHGRKMNKSLSIKADALDLLVNHNWKGNVRELENVIERAAILSENGILNQNSFKFLSNDIYEGNVFNLSGNMDLKDLEKNYILKVLEENDGNKLQAAAALGIDRKTLYNKIKMYKLE